MTRIGVINKNQIIPDDYVPNRHITVCSNEISDYSYLISDSGFYPILIGDGEIPRIWMFTKNRNLEVITLIEDNISYFGQIRVEIDSSRKSIEIKDLQSKKHLLKLDYNNVVKVNILNLRPLGYNVYGDEKELNVGNARLSGNKFSNVNTIIGFGDPPARTES